MGRRLRPKWDNHDLYKTAMILAGGPHIEAEPYKCIGRPIVPCVPSVVFVDPPQELQLWIPIFRAWKAYREALQSGIWILEWQCE